MKTAAIYVVYNPEMCVLERSLKIMSSQVGRIFVIDNSEVPFCCTAVATDGTEVISFGENKGIGAALNEGFRRADAMGFDMVITMDQDSIPTEDMVERLSKGAGSAAQIGPAYSFRGLGMKSSTGLREVDHVITSGALTSVEAWKSAGGFREDLFIDMVDIDFSHRLRKAGYRVVQMQDVIMDHHLGDSRSGIMILGKLRLVYVEHSPVRWYYIVRNSILVCDRKFRLKRVWKNVLKMIVFGKERGTKLRMVARGIRDGIMKRTGRITLL